MNPAALAIVAVAVGAVAFFSRRRGVGAATIQSPRIAFLNLKGTAGEQILAEDKSALASMFSTVQESSTTPPPTCDVLFIYCDIDSNGRIACTTAGLREIIRDSGARVVVVASENDGDNYMASADKNGFGHANVVLTLNRSGPVFPTFFSRLFRDMMNGTTMPMAWVKLAPQIPGHDHPDCPGTIFSAGAGQIAFA
jgi:hypothetical protein